jgi:hypothetical protein
MSFEPEVKRCNAIRSWRWTLREFGSYNLITKHRQEDRNEGCGNWLGKKRTGRSGSQSVRWGTSSKTAPPEPVKILAVSAFADICTSFFLSWFLDKAIPGAACMHKKRSFLKESPPMNEELLLLMNRSWFLLVFFPLPALKPLCSEDDDIKKPPLQVESRCCCLNSAAETSDTMRELRQGEEEEAMMALWQERLYQTLAKQATGRRL